MAYCKNCSGDFGNGMLYKNRGANLHVRCDRNSENYKDFSCEDAIRDYQENKIKEKEENDNKDLEKANEGISYINLGDNNE